jgi:hypothetical protein
MFTLSNGRELDLEMKLLDGWVRYRCQGELLPLPEEWQQRFDAEKRRADDLQRRLEAVERELKRLKDND